MLVSFMDFSVEYLELGQLRQLQTDRLINLISYLGEKSEFYKRKFDEAGIKVSSIGSPIGKIGIDDDFTTHLILFKHVMQLAMIFESPYVRLFSFFIDSSLFISECTN